MIQIGCEMQFFSYPFDVQECTFRLGSFSFTDDEIMYAAKFIYNPETQRHLPFQVSMNTIGDDGTVR